METRSKREPGKQSWNEILGFEQTAGDQDADSEKEFASVSRSFKGTDGFAVIRGPPALKAVGEQDAPWDVTARKEMPKRTKSREKVSSASAVDPSRNTLCQLVSREQRLQIYVKQHYTRLYCHCGYTNVDQSSLYCQQLTQWGGQSAHKC